MSQNDTPAPVLDHANQDILTAQDVRFIFQESGFMHALFCVEQAATQAGHAALAVAFAELAKIEAETFR